MNSRPRTGGAPRIPVPTPLAGTSAWALGLALVGSAATTGCSEPQPCAGASCAPDSGTLDGSLDGGPEPGRCDADPFVDRQLGGALGDEVRGIAFLGEALVAVGYEGGVGGVSSFEPGGDATGFVSFRDATGAETRRVDFATSGTDTVEALTLGPEPGQLTVVGRTSGSLGGPNAGQMDTFLAILDASGSVATLAQGGNERPQHPMALGWRDHTLFVAGYDDTYVPTNYVEAWEDGTIERWTLANGALARDFAFAFGSGASDFLYGLAVPPTADAPIYVAGVLVSGTERGPFVRSTSPVDGSELWRGRVGTNGFDNAAAVLFDADGNLLVAGSSFHAFGAPVGQQDAFLLRIDATTGALLASTSDGSVESDWVTAAVRDADGNVYVAGETIGAVVGEPPAAGEADMFVLRFDRDFALTGRWQSHRAGDESLSGVALDPCGRVVVSGYVEGTYVSGQAKGGRDGVIARVVF